MTKKKPEEEIPAVRPDQPYDRNRIERFIHHTLGHSEDGPDGVSTAAAASLLLDLLGDMDQGRELKPRFKALGYSGRAYTKKQIAMTDLSGQHMEIAWRYYQGEIKEEDAIQELMDLTGRADDTVADYLKSLKKRIKEHRTIIALMVNMGRTMRKNCQG